METPQIRVKVEGFRAIAKADIIIDGITVVAGENGSGKSTLSKLLYFLYKTANNYDRLIADELERNLRDVEQFLIIIQHEFQYPSKEIGKQEELRGIEKELSKLRRNNKIDEKQMRKWISLIGLAADAYSLHSSDIKESKLRISKTKRLNYIMRDIAFRNPSIQGILISDVLNEKDNTVTDLSLPFDKIKEFVELQYKEAIKKVNSRPTSIFLNVLISHFQIGELPKLFEVFEFEEKIVSLEKNNLSIPYSVQSVVYIDTPMMIGIENSDNQYWNDLNELLKKNGNSSFSILSRTIINEIIRGDVSFVIEPSNPRDFQFKRADGSIFNLLDCATGVKSFAILQLLLKNGSLTDKTLLIIDEPESNLHPQWIIEYARLIVLLYKNIGMKFFIASHNPDMVSALKYISMKEGTDKNLNFYLAEETDKKYSYNYKHLGTDIEPIFGSFNIAMERINQFGA